MPLPYRAWNRLGLFEHGSMKLPDYSMGVFLSHFGMAAFEGRSGCTCLEIGPGGSLCSAMIAKAKGTTRCWMVDSGDLAQRDVLIYHSMARHLEQLGLMAPPPEALASFDTLLADCNATYLTGGIDSSRTVPNVSVDLI